MRIGVLGAGAVGSRAVRQLSATPSVDEVLVADVDPIRARNVANAIAKRVREVPADDLSQCDVVVLASPAPHADVAATLLRAGAHVVSVSDDVGDVRALFDLGVLADDRGLALVVGASFAPGFTCLLVRYGSRQLDALEEIHVAKHGTGGPACARQHHRALAGIATDWRDGSWQERPAGSGRELCWFPSPIGALDCYRAEVTDPFVLVRALPDVRRITSRMSATRRDRLTARLPMLRPPHPEGGLGAVRVELRGTRDGARATEILGALDRAGIAAGAVAAVAAVEVAATKVRTGAFGLADPAIDARGLLVELARRGVKAARFVGSAAQSNTW
jgi:saccharopine dehydrogenase-like NADP-dependent oxidoreductase